MMGALVTAYIGALLAIGAYLGWLALQHKRLTARIDELQRSHGQQDHEPSRSKAA